MKHKLATHEGRHRLSVAHLLVAIVVMFVVAPFADQLLFGRFIESVVFTVMLLAAMNAVGGRRRTLIIAALLVTPALVTRWIDHVRPGLLPDGPSHVATIVFVSFVIWQLLRFVMSAPVVTGEVLCAALSIYLLYAVVWAFVYTLLVIWQPEALIWTAPPTAQSPIVGFTSLYFSATILTALAFGDILPVTPVARMMTLVEVTSGIFYVTILIARLVGMYSTQPPELKH